MLIVILKIIIKRIKFLRKETEREEGRKKGKIR